MKKTLVFLLVATLLLSSCSMQSSSDQDNTTVTTTASTVDTTVSTTEANVDSLTEDEKAILQNRRDIVEAEMRKMMSVLWRVDEDITYSIIPTSVGPEADAKANPGKVFTLVANRIYSGLPYTHGSGSGDSYLSYGELDEDGIYNLTDLKYNSLNGSSGILTGRSARVGNDCSDAVFWAWGRISDSINFTCCKEMARLAGGIKVGEYECDDVTYKNTQQTVRNNGEQVMYKAYSQLQKGDGIVMYDGAAGHAIMVVDIHVEYNGDQIDPVKSYALIHEQTGSGVKDGKTRYDEKIGETVFILGTVDNKYPFLKLYSNGYLPVTCKELVDPSPLNEPTISDNIPEPGLNNLYSGKISCNFRISHMIIEITDKSGEVVQKSTCYAREEEKHKFKMSSFEKDYSAGVTQGVIDIDALAAGDYTCTVYAHISTGNVLQARQFKFTK